MSLATEPERMLHEILAEEDADMRDKDVDFIESVAKQNEQGFALSPDQEEWIRDIWERIFD